MRHTQVTRVALELVALLAAAALVFAWLAGRPAADAGRSSAEVSGERRFEEHCARCHVDADLAHKLRAEADSDAAVRAWLVLLQDHGDATRDEDQAIVDHLRRLAQAASSAPRAPRR